MRTRWVALTLVPLAQLLFAGENQATDWSQFDLWTWPTEPLSGSNLATMGTWSGPQEIKDGSADLSPVHAALVPFVDAFGDSVGKIVAYRGSVWKIYTLAGANAGEVTISFESTNVHRPFCNGTNFTKDGKLVVIGGSLWEQDGTDPHPPGITLTPTTEGWTSIFDPQADTFTKVTSCDRGTPCPLPGGPMNYGRYYPTATSLPDGKILLTAGDTWCENNVTAPAGPGYDDDPLLEELEKQELWAVYDPDLNTWSSLSGTMLGWRTFPGSVINGQALDYYPHIKILPAGIFWEGWDSSTLASYLWLWGSWDRVNNLRNDGVRNESSCVIMTLEPGKPQTLLIVGGGSPLNIKNTAEWISYEDHPTNGWQATTGPTGTWTYTNDFDSNEGYGPLGRRRPDVVMLPTGDAFLIGGECYDVLGARIGNRHCEMLYANSLDPDPAQNKPGDWTEMAMLTNDRRYHSAALLLPDGRVFVTGNEEEEAQGATYEVFYPPYLFDSATTFAKRPEITGGLHELHYGLNATVVVDHEDSGVMDPAAEIAEVCLVKLSTSTHATNMSQRRVKLSAVRYDANTLVIQAPVDSTWAPPGDYMLFVIDNSGVPSLADFVNVNGDGAYIVQGGETAIWGGECRLSRDFKVEAGGTLEILPGTVVTVEDDDQWNLGNELNEIEILIAGQLLAQGAVDAAITFTSGAESPAKGDWHGVTFLGDAADTRVSDLSYCDFEYPTHAVTVDSLSGDIFNCTFMESESADIYADGDVVIQPGHEWALLAPTWVVFESDASLVDSPLGEPGVCDLIVKGTLNTIRPPSALSTDWVVFESTPPDQALADNWAGITVAAGADAQIEDANIGYAMRPVYFAYANTATLRNSLIHDFSVEGVLGWFSTVLIEGCTFGSAQFLDPDIKASAIRLHHSTGDVLGNLIGWQQGYGIWFGTSVSFCAGPGTFGGDGTMAIRDNTIVGENGVLDRQSSAGIFGVGLCHEFVTIIESNTVENWRGQALNLKQVADVDISCNRFEDSFLAARFKTSVSGFGLLDGEGQANFAQNTFKRSHEENFSFEGDVETISLDDNGSGSVAGRNSFQLSTFPFAKFLHVKPSYTFAVMDAGQGTWLDEFGASMTNEAAIKAECVFVGESDALFSPILTEDLCVAAKAQVQGPGSAALDDPERALSAPETKIPTVWRLGGGWPNPARGSLVRISFDVPQGHEGAVSLTIYDIAGRRVASLEDGVLAPGTYTRVWRGTGAAGRAVSSGVYFVRLEAEGHRSTSKIVVTR